jgi:Prion-inhibition and propagation
MEPASLTVGVVGLAGLFSACMECFDYLQLGQAFGEDYGKCLLRLDAAKLRFSRWGEAMGIALSS